MNINFRHILIALAAILGFVATSCSDDNEFRTKPDGRRPLELMVPAARFTSRATDATEPELQYTSLFFFAFNQNTSKAPVIVPLHETDDNPQLDVPDGWRPYPLELEEGNYHFYLVANVWDKDTDTADLPQTEGELKDDTFLEFPDAITCNIPSIGLAMSAGHTDFSFINLEGETTSMTTDQWFHYNGEGGSLYALLTFLYAKISVIPQDAASGPVQVTDVSFSNLSKSEPIIFRTGYDYGTIATAVPTVPDGTPEVIDFYIPERYVSESSPESQSSLSFKIGEKEITLPLGAVPGTTIDEETVVPSGDAYRELQRGAHYTYTIVTTDKVILEVQKWTPEMVAAKLAGPVYLHIEQQVYEVTAGELTPIWFDSNAANVRIDSPDYTTDEGDVIKLYDYSVDANQDTIRVWVNDAIPANEYQRIKQSIQAEEGLYDYVHIVAGNINKRITIYPLNLDNYLVLNPQSMSIDVKLRVASGEYSGLMPVSIRSNYPKVRVTLTEGWSDLPALEFGSGVTPANYPIRVTEMTYDPDNNPVLGSQVTLSSPQDTEVTKGKIYYAVSFSGLNSGKEVWKSDRTLKFKVQGIDNDGNLVDDFEEFTIKIFPSILNYKIHFKAQKGDWDLPHIYIYQCLEFPADYTQTANFNGQQVSLASKPIGYYPRNDDRSEPFAALEYSFTGALGFRGWEFPVNYSLLYNDDGTEKSPAGSTKQGFFIFNNISNTWDFQNSPADAKTRYNTEMDFCSEHRAYVSDPAHEHHCTQCAWSSSAMNRMWPGIMMKYEEEDDGWYEFELTGIAEPGKTLIMFGNGHSDSNPRFPGAAQVGVPLFDYPSREGWFLYNGNEADRVNNQFHPEKPGAVSPVEKEYRIFWPSAQANSEQVHLWIEGGRDITNWGYDKEDNGKSQGTFNGYKYYTFTSNAAAGQTIGYLFHTHEVKFDNTARFASVGTFTANSQGILCAYFNGEKLVSGEPPATGQTTEFRIFWPENQANSDQVHVWVKNGSGITDYENGGGYQGTLNGYRYFTFESDAADSREFGFKFHVGNSSHYLVGNDAEFFCSVSNFTANADGIRCAYFTGTVFASGEPHDRVNSFRFYWPKTLNNKNYNKLYCWYNDGANHELNGSWSGNSGTEDNNYYYVDFNYSGTLFTNFNFIINDGSNKYVENDMVDSFTKFIYVSSESRMCAYLDPTTNKLVPGKPN